MTLNRFDPWRLAFRQGIARVLIVALLAVIYTILLALTTLRLWFDNETQRSAEFTHLYSSPHGTLFNTLSEHRDNLPHLCQRRTPFEFPLRLSFGRFAGTAIQLRQRVRPYAYTAMLQHERRHLDGNTGI